jgi:hypothetical protein
MKAPPRPQTLVDDTENRKLTHAHQARAMAKGTRFGRCAAAWA